MLAGFVQLEFAGLIGLPEGRYLAREGGDERVLIVQTPGAPRSRRRRRRGRFVPPADPDQVPVTRVTVTGPTRFEDRRSAERWLQRTASAAEERAARVRSATGVVNRALGALRAAARDPLVQEVGASRALAVRIGFGSGEELAEGRWSEARELPAPRRGRLEGIDPQGSVAAVLAGRERVHPAETLLQRARLDLEQGRLAEARFGLRAASAALDEQPADAGDLGERIRETERRLRDILTE